MMDSSSSKWLLLVVALCTLREAVALQPTATGTKPHIVFMMVDDWGWANVGYHRDPPTKEVVTPNIDALVKEGLELDQHYAFQVCSPSRSSFLSGRLPIHVNDENIDPNVHNPKDPISGFQGIPRNMTVIAEKLAEAGYMTHQVGKWDAGMATPDHTPKGRGFMSSFGYFHHANDFYTEIAGGMCDQQHIVDLWDYDKPAKDMNGTDYEGALFRNHILDVVNQHDPSSPLFLYYAPHIVHAPLEVPDEYLKKFDFIDDKVRQTYHAMVNYLDDVVGELVDALKKKGLWDNLLFVASSDNGGPEYRGGGANNYPLKGSKTTGWQGGIRVNAFVSGGFLPEKMRGKKTEGYIHLADWYGTFCGLAGVDPTDEKAAKAKLPPVDSHDMWPLISGQTDVSPRTDVPANNYTLISGNYKLLIGDVRMAGWTGPQYPNLTNPAGGFTIVEHCGDGCLYDIMKDPEERDNLATKMPDVLKSMQEKYDSYMKTYFNPDRGGVAPEACEAALNKYKGFWGPFLD